MIRKIRFKHGFLLIVLLAVVAGCYSGFEKETVYYTDFPITKKLKAQTIEIDTALFRYPFRIRVKDSLLVIMDLHNAHHYFHVFDYPSMTYQSSFGKRGESPEEMLSAENFRFYGDNKIWALDANKVAINAFSHSPSGKLIALEEVISLDDQLLRPLDFCIFNDTTVIIPDYSGENRFCWVNSLGHLTKKTGTVPTRNNEALQNSKPALAQAWRSFVDYNPDNHTLVAATQLGESIEIYNTTDETRIVIQGPYGEPEFQLAGVYAIPSGIMGFSDIQITKEKIYAVFHGRSFKEMANGPMIDGGQFIYVFDLKGNPLCKYQLDRYINGCYVDEGAGFILATDVNNDQSIVKFNI